MVTQETMTAGLGLTYGRWELDPMHSQVTFSIRHLGLSRVRGSFERFDATLDVGETPADTRVNATIDLASVNTNQPDRDAHLRSTDFFSVELHPTMTFTSTAITGDGDNWSLAGELTLNGRTQPLTFAVDLNGTEVFPGNGKQHVGFSASGALRRSAFGIEFGMLPLGADKLALGDEVKIEIEVQFVEPVAAR